MFDAQLLKIERVIVIAVATCTLCVPIFNTWHFNDSSSFVNARSVKHDESKRSEKSCSVWLGGSSVTTAIDKAPAPDARSKPQTSRRLLQVRSTSRLERAMQTNRDRSVNQMDLTK